MRMLFAVCTHHRPQVRRPHPHPLPCLQTRTYGGDAAAQAASRATLVYVFEAVLRLLHPYMPFVTEELWQAIPHKGGWLWAGRQLWRPGNRTLEGSVCPHPKAVAAAARGQRTGN
jgi:valyl-tRNA synthetase